MRRRYRCLQVFLVLALVFHGGMAPLHVAAAEAADDAIAATATQASTAEHDCHGSAPPPAPAAEQTSAGPCEHGDCVVCLCAPPQQASMTLLLWVTAANLEAEQRTRLTGVRHILPPAPRLRPPIA